ncbi:MAG: serine hydrolase domain-containing protein [Bacteroidota bacterium]
MISRAFAVTWIIGTLLLLNQCKNANLKYDKIDELFSKWNNGGSPGCTVLIYQNDKVIYKKAFGMANISDSIPLQITTQFHVASITKQFTGMAIAILESRNLIKKDDEIINYVPELPNYRKPITIEHLLNHTSGIPEYQYLEELAGMDGRNGVSQEIFFDLLEVKNDLNNNPGERYIYSNSNYALLAIIIERVTGMSFSEFVSKEIFHPLKMNDSKFITNIKDEDQKQMAHGYNLDHKVEEPRINPNLIIGHSGLITTIENLGIWVRALMNRELPGSVSLTQKPVWGHYNYGLQYFHHHGLPTISHGGVHFGFRSNILIFPDQDFFVIILGNIDDRDFFYNNYTIADILLEDSYKKIEVETEPKSNVDKLTEKFINKYFDEVVQISFTDSALNITNYQKGENFVAFQSDKNVFVSSTSSGRKTYQFNQKRDSLQIINYDGSTEIFHRAEDFYPPTRSLEHLAGPYLSKDVGFTLNLTIDEDGIINSDFDSEYFNNFHPLTSEIWMNNNVNMMTMKFQYNEGKVCGFSLSLDRLKDLQFKRLN